MKLAPLLVKYLAANGQLSLPGIGTFLLKNFEDPDGRKVLIPTSITFNNDKVDMPPSDLVDFIASETGKMKVLADSDLSSQLGDALQFINTGKPYFIAGIGTLTKKIDGSFDFAPEKYSAVQEKRREKDAPITEVNTMPKTFGDGNRRRPGGFKAAGIIITLSLIAIAAAVWFYVRNSENHSAPEAANKPPVALQHTASTSSATDSSAIQTPAVTASSTITYVLETAKEPRASKRYNQLKSIDWPVELEIVDSLNKRIVMKLPAAGADTTRTKDSLSVQSGRKVWIAR